MGACSVGFRPRAGVPLTAHELRSGRLGEISWAIAARAYPGESESGDVGIALESGGRVILALADGLGHGPQAAHAARVAKLAVDDARDAPLLDLFARCDLALRNTRGVVMSAAALGPETGRMEWAGVGNVAGIVVRSEPRAPHIPSLTPRGGVLGAGVKPARLQVVHLARGDLVVLSSDGLRHEFVADLRPSAEPAMLAARMVRLFGRDTDDASILIARYDP